MSTDIQDYYELPPHTHVADVALHLHRDGYMVAASMVDAGDMDNPVEHNREWFITTDTPVADAHRSGWVFNDEQLLDNGRTAPQFPPPDYVQRTGRELLDKAATDARFSASDGERAARSELSGALATIQSLRREASDLRYAEHELSHVEPQDNVYSWFRTAIAEMATYGSHDAQFGLTELTGGWKLLKTHGPGSPEVSDWFSEHSTVPEYPMGDEMLHPHQGASAHQSSIWHLHRFEHEFNGHVDSKVSENVAAAVDKARSTRPVSATSDRNPDDNSAAHRAAGPLQTGSAEQSTNPRPAIASPRPAHLMRKDQTTQNQNRSKRS